MTRTLLIGLLAGLVAPSFAHAQGDPDAQMRHLIAEREKARAAVQDEPYELLRRADAALLEAGAIRYSATRTGHGFIASQGPSVSGTVTASMRDGSLRFRIEGKTHEVDGARPEFLASFDGKQAVAIRHGARAARTGPLDSSYGVLEGTGAGLISWLLLWDDHIGGAFRNGEQPYPVQYEGLVLVNDKPHHLLQLGFNEYWGVMEFETWLYLDTDDFLPRRIELGYYNDMGMMGMVHVAMDQMQALPSVDAEVFNAQIPEGYLTEEYQAQADDFARGDMPSRAIPVGDAAPNWTLQDVNGNDFSLEDYRGRVVVMDFWATWCGPCIMAMPGLQELHEEFKNQPVSILGINCWESSDPAAFMQSKGFTYGLLVGADQVAAQYGVQGIPTFYVIGKDGTVIFHEVGYDPDGTNKLREVIKKALAEE